VVLFVLSLIPLSRRRRSFSAKVLPLVVCTLFLVLGAVGCNGSGTTTTPATPYTVTVTATSGTVSQSSSFVLLLSK
jgi:apolipoprotein N-acyltransferase